MRVFIPDISRKSIFLNYLELRVKRDFAIINFRELGLIKNFTGINFWKINPYKDFAENEFSVCLQENFSATLVYGFENDLSNNYYFLFP